MSAGFFIVCCFVGIVLVKSANIILLLIDNFNMNDRELDRKDDE